MTRVVYLNGDYCDASDAVFDRSLLFADAIYEIISACKGQPFRLNSHLSGGRYWSHLNENQQINLKYP